MTPHCPHRTTCGLLSLFWHFLKLIGCWLLQSSLRRFWTITISLSTFSVLLSTAVICWTFSCLISRWHHLTDRGVATWRLVGSFDDGRQHWPIDAVLRRGALGPGDRSIWMRSCTTWVSHRWFCRRCLTLTDCLQSWSATTQTVHPFVDVACRRGVPNHGTTTNVATINEWLVVLSRSFCVACSSAARYTCRQQLQHQRRLLRSKTTINQSTTISNCRHDTRLLCSKVGLLLGPCASCQQHDCASDL